MRYITMIVVLAATGAVQAQCISSFVGGFSSLPASDIGDALNVDYDICVQRGASGCNLSIPIYYSPTSQLTGESVQIGTDSVSVPATGSFCLFTNINVTIPAISECLRPGTHYILINSPVGPVQAIPFQSANTICDDQQFCNGSESCGAGTCLDGTDPCSGTSLTCSEAIDECICFTALQCDNGVFCDGQEFCSGGDCFSGSAPCGSPIACNESIDMCCEESGDYDFDCDIDLADYGRFNDCFGPTSGMECDRFDFDSDGDIDLQDFGAFQLAFTG